MPVIEPRSWALIPAKPAKRKTTKAVRKNFFIKALLLNF
jgi:hypothetical protein